MRCSDAAECVSQTDRFGRFEDGYPPAACAARPLNIRGQVLVLDVGSMSYSGGPNHPPAVTTALECCQVGEVVRQRGRRARDASGHTATNGTDPTLLSPFS